MRGKLVIDCDERFKKTKYYFEDGFGFDDDWYKNYDYLIGLDLSENNKFDFTKFKQGFYRYLIKKLESKKYSRDFPDRVKLIKKAFDQDIDLLDNIFEIDVYNYNEELFQKICDFFKNSNIPIIMKNGKYPMSKEGYEEACNKYHNNPNVLVTVEGNRDPISLEAFGKTIDKIEELVRKIKSYNLSPLEEVIYVFDYAKNRYYQSEDEGKESPGKSRDLTSVLLGDKVVCEGYAAIFATILQKLGFQASKYYVKCCEYNGGHVINIVRIKDDKYKIDGIYYFDPTGDAKEKDTIGLNRYNYCGNYSPGSKYIDVTFGDVSFNSTWWDDSDAWLLEKIKNNMYLSGDEERRINEFYSMYAFENGSCDLKDNRGVFHSKDYNQFKSKITPEFLSKFISKFASEFKILDNYVLFQAIYNVRKIEYYENPEEFPLSDYDLYLILLLLQNTDRQPSFLEEDVSRFIDSKKKEISSIRLTKVLSNISKKK